jgi:hypothetical protein
MKKKKKTKIKKTKDFDDVIVFPTFTLYKKNKKNVKSRGIGGSHIY